MHSTSRAPELSATLSRLSCWITLSRSLAANRDTRLAGARSLASALCSLPFVRRASSRPLQHFDDAPPLQMRQRTGLRDPDAVDSPRVDMYIVPLDLAGA